MSNVKYVELCGKNVISVTMKWLNKEDATCPGDFIAILSLDLECGYPSGYMGRKGQVSYDAPWLYYIVILPPMDLTVVIYPASISHVKKKITRKIW